MGVRSMFVAFAALLATEAASEHATVAVAANPIRKVVTMLQMMQKKIASEAEKETELYEKYMCYCKTSGSTLAKSIADAEAKVKELGPAIEEAEAQMKQLKEDVEAHKADRAAAKAAMAKATAIREKEAAAFAKENAEDMANLDALERAIAAISKGSAGGFLQTSASALLRRVVLAERDMDEDNRQELLAFLSGKAVAPAYGNEYVPQSGEILGILKQLHDEMAKDLAEAIAAEEAAIAAYKELMAAKEKEVAALTKMIEEKLTRIAELGVEIATMKNDLGDTAEGIIEDKKFLADLEKNCATKEQEWAEICKQRQLELVALADTIKILNDDDALELFKKTLPSSFVQIQVTAESMRARALSIVQQAQQASKVGRPQLDFIALTLRGKKIGFEKVIKMIDDMVVNLKAEQTADDEKKKYCTESLDTADDKKKELEHSIAGLETSISKTKDAIAATKEEVEALEDAIKALDKMVAEATEQRKEENEDFTELMAQDSAAKEVILFAKNRLNKFYNPKLYTPPPKRELTEDERITVNNGGTLAPTAPPAGIAGTGITVLAEVSKDAPPPPPESFSAYAKKTEESNGVMAMMDLLVKDLDKEMTVATATEKDAQADYETLIKESAEKRAADSKSLEDKEAAIAEMQGFLESETEAKAADEKELAGTLEVIASLHAECDWLLKYFDVRKDARASEIDALGRAKAVLSGADYSLLQTARAHGLLRRY